MDMCVVYIQIEKFIKRRFIEILRMERIQTLNVYFLHSKGNSLDLLVYSFKSNKILYVT